MISATVRMPKQPDKDQILAILDAYIKGLERGYILIMSNAQAETEE
jgi:hypothetical protein